MSAAAVLTEAAESVAPCPRLVASKLGIVYSFVITGNGGAGV